VFAEDCIGVFDVGAGEGLDGILESCEAGDDLWMLLVRAFQKCLLSDVRIISLMRGPKLGLCVRASVTRG